MRDFATDFKLTPLNDTNTAFLKEYVECLRPIAVALDKLQGEKAVIMGDLIPCILNAHFLLGKLHRKEGIRFCKGVIEVIMTSLKDRFQIIFDWHLHNNKTESLPFVMASLTSPALKIRWIDTAAKKVLATQWLLDEVQSLKDPDNSGGDRSSPAVHLDRDHAYEFMAEEETCAENESDAHLQVAQYLNDKSMQYAILKKYTLVEQLFFKFNAGKQQFKDISLDNIT